MKYFKVIDPLSKVEIIDTNNYNYGKNFVDKTKYKDLLSFIEISSFHYDLPMDFIISLHNKLKILGNDYVVNLPKPKNGIYNIADLTHNENHNEFLLTESDLFFFIESLLRIDTPFFNKGTYLWEYILEYVRNWSDFTDKPSREESIFLFENIHDCKYYIEKNCLLGTIKEVEVIDLKSIFKGDMNIIDSMENYLTFKQAIKYAYQYWNEEISDKPIYEILFQGKCKLHPY